MERLIIRVDASTQIGAGHLMRCLALGQAWQDTGARAAFITACQDEGLLQRLREEGFDIHRLARPYPDPVDWDYTEKVLSASPDAWVVLDGYHFDEVYQQRVKQAGHRLLVIDDTAHLKHYYADIVLNQNLHAEQLKYSCQRQTRRLLGTRYVLLRREFLAWRGWQRQIPEVARRVLVTLGGGDPQNHTLQVMQALQKIDIPGLEAVVIIGASNPHADTLEAAAGQSHIPIRLIRDARNMPDLMAWADVAISGGGSTTWELAFMGLPGIIVVLAPNQEINAKVLQEKGIALHLNLKNDATAIQTNLLPDLLNNQQARTDMSRAGRAIVDGLGASKVIGTMMAYSPVS